MMNIVSMNGRYTNTILLIYYFIENLSWQNKNISFMYIFAII